MRTVFFMCVLASSACLRTTEYRCSGDTSCSGGGVCEATGYCSFPDGECSSGRRYNDSAGSLGGTCTSGGGTTDDASDTNMPSDVPTDTSVILIDGPVAQCPSGYVTVTGGEAGHMYKVLTAGANFATQEQQCQLTTVKAHLFAPADIGELTAVDTLVGGTGTYWTGINDQTTQGTYVNTFGVAQTYLPWASGNPSSQAMDACTYATNVGHQIAEDRCNVSRPAVCECVP